MSHEELLFQSLQTNLAIRIGRADCPLWMIGLSPGCVFLEPGKPFQLLCLTADSDSRQDLAFRPWSQAIRSPPKIDQCLG